MDKKEKVITGLRCCIVHAPDDSMQCTACPYKDPNTYCLNRLKMDALEVLLLKQEGVTEQDVTKAIVNVKRPYDVSFEQYADIMANVAEALADIFEKKTCSPDYCEIEEE